MLITLHKTDLCVLLGMALYTNLRRDGYRWFGAQCIWGYQYATCWRYSNQGDNSSPPEQNGRHFTDDIFICIFVNEKFCILILRVRLTITQPNNGLVPNRSHYLNQCWPDSVTYMWHLGGGGGGGVDTVFGFRPHTHCDRAI